MDSLTDKILGYCALKYPQWVHKGAILRKTIDDWGYETENAGRRCREQASGRIGSREHLIEFAPALEGREVNGCAEYRWIPPEYRMGPKRETLAEKKERDMIDDFFARMHVETSKYQ